jgi:acetyl esterase/lipase
MAPMNHLLLAAALVWQPTPGHVQVPLWPSNPAGKPESMESDPKNLIGGKRAWAIHDVSRPTLTVYRPKGRDTGATVMVLPGGGYEILAVDLEGTEVCDWLNARGITGVLLKYRVPGHPGPHRTSPNALADGQRAMGLLRLHAKEWHLDPHKIGVLGFSAGGHLVAAMSTHFTRAYKPVDAADRESCRPDFGVALYPGHLAVDGGDRYVLNPDIRVTAKTPPQFIVQAEDDPVDRVENSLVYYAGLRKAGVPAEMHLYAHGGHAFGLRPTQQPITQWPGLLEPWLRTIGMVP